MVGSYGLEVASAGIASGEENIVKLLFNVLFSNNYFILSYICTRGVLLHIIRVAYYNVLCMAHAL